VLRNWASGRLKAPVFGSRTSFMFVWSVGALEVMIRGWWAMSDGLVLVVADVVWKLVNVFFDFFAFLRYFKCFDESFRSL
jgi:hypothetical protein